MFERVSHLVGAQPPILGQAYGGDSNTGVTLYDPIGPYGFVGIRARF